MKATLLILGLLFANLSLAQEKWEYCQYSKIQLGLGDTKAIAHTIFHPNIKIAPRGHRVILWIVQEISGKAAEEEKRLDKLMAAHLKLITGISLDLSKKKTFKDYDIVSAIGEDGWELVSILKEKDDIKYWFKRKSK